MTAMLERPVIVGEPVAEAVQPAVCPPWCGEGSNHFEDGYHLGHLGTADVASTVKGKRLTFTVTVGCLPGQEPNILASTDGFDGFEGSPDEIEALGHLLIDAAVDARDDGAAAGPQICGPAEPEHVARLSEGMAAAEEAAAAVERVVGHLVEVCTGDDDQDVAVLLYPSDVRALLLLAGVPL
jgi:hypothetical protein